MSVLDQFFDPSITVRPIPCDITMTPNLRKAAQDFRPEVWRAKVSPSTGIVRIYTTTGDVHVLDCSTREGDKSFAIRDILIGAGIYSHSPNQIPLCLTDRKASKGKEYWVEMA